jgi:hypothetical protein
MIWFDVVVILLLTLRMVFLDQRWQATMERRTNLFNSPKVGFTTLGVLQLHIHVMPDSKVRW